MVYSVFEVYLSTVKPRFTGPLEGKESGPVNQEGTFCIDLHIKLVLGGEN